MRRTLVLTAVALTASCVEVISLTRAPDDAAPDDVSPRCPEAPQDNWVSTWMLPDTNPCLPGEPIPRACRVVVTVPAGETLAGWCTASRGRSPIAGSTTECAVNAAPSFLATGVLSPAEHGFYLAQGRCVVLTDEPGGWRTGLRARLECALANPSVATSMCTRRPLGVTCSVGAPSRCLLGDAGADCELAAGPVLRVDSNECESRLCLATSSADASRAGACACRCALADGVDASASPRCACPAGFTCTGVFDHPTLPPDMRGRYCVLAR